MPKRITILDPNGVEVADQTHNEHSASWSWLQVVRESCETLSREIERDNPKLGTYTVTVKEVEE